jgi:4'-phosphopantetheinyl transferase
MLELHPDRINLWCVFYKEISDVGLLNRYRLLLTKEEQHRERRFYFAKDRHRYLVTRALVRTVLSRYAPITPEQWSFTQNANGKPCICNDDLLARKFSFNVSHTDGLIVLGLTAGVELGVDAERVRIRPTLLEAANSFFSREESSAIALLPYHMQHERFFQYWTLKESYVKARGMGLKIPMDAFSFQFLQPNRVRLSIHTQLKDLASRWRFWQFRPSEHHLTAVCAEHCGHPNQRLVLNKIVPFREEQALNCVPLLESA